MAAGAARCANCGTAAEPGQLVCLSCGARIALTHRRPPSWKVPLAIVVTVAVVAALVLAALLMHARDSSDREVGAAAVAAMPQAPAAPATVGQRCAT